MTDRPSLEDLDTPLEPARWCCDGNAEDCPLCTDPNPPYPWICPGHPRTAANERIVGETAQVTPATDLTFFTRVMEIFYLSDNRDDLIWHVTDGRVHLGVNVSDIFAWGGADSEPITPETLPALEQAWRDTKAIGQEFLMAPLYAARVRGERPQGAAYPKTAAAQALFNACGPEREVGLGNPRPVPVAVDQESTR